MMPTEYYERTLEAGLLAASEQFPVLLVTGPRQVGKTTLLRHSSGEQRRYVTLDDLALRALAREDPALFLQRFAPPLLIDEIQYAPELLPYLNRDKDGHEIDFLFVQDGVFHPLEVKLAATPRRSWAGGFSVLDKLGTVGEGAVLCLCPEPVPLSASVTALPVGVI